jgi:hypothetical protein
MEEAMKQYKESEDAGWGLFERRVIGRSRGDTDKPLFTRWTLVRTPWFALRLHRFHRADPSCHHDHPWPFISLILQSGYVEETPIEQPAGRFWPLFGARWRVLSRSGAGQGSHDRTFYGPGCLLVRPATWKHRVMLYPSAGEPLTLVLSGKRIRDWGFWTRAQGWLNWRKFGVAEDDC